MIQENFWAVNGAITPEFNAAVSVRIIAQIFVQQSGYLELTID
jgi:hypothetical protein